jgi:predicted O-linked N-acetylglucosamine transferase (SPINDLY family)
MAQLFERHDRNRFELFAFDNGTSDGSEIRSRVVRAFDEFVDITRSTDLQAASAVRERRIDLLIDLNGYSGLNRPGVFACRPSPVHVSYLGWPGTTGADCIDYLIADRHIIPAGCEAHYTEKVVYLPDTYQVNDPGRAVAQPTPTRSEAGLPATGFVFCCFNNNYKITPEVFDIWMRLLREAGDSVLWLLEDNAAASRNLRLEARGGASSPRGLFLRRGSTTRATSPAICWRTCSSIRCRITPTRRHATRSGRACRS